MTISKSQRQVVRDRAGNCCEYCRLPASSSSVPFHVDHIIPIKHGGSDDNENLCLACYKCNSHKSHDLVGFDPETQEIARLFHPREQHWVDHFEIRPDMWIMGLTPEGRATVNV